jgi:hypothetical protein
VAEPRQEKKKFSKLCKGKAKTLQPVVQENRTACCTTGWLRCSSDGQRKILASQIDANIAVQLSALVAHFFATICEA